MHIDISQSHKEMGAKIATLAISKLKEAIKEQGEARVLLSTGMSQVETYHHLIKSEIDWSKIEVFHMDEYIGLPVTHKASFIKYLRERFIDHVKVKKFHPVATEGDVRSSIQALTAAIKERPVDVGIIGIGENTHIGFNDPPADFETREAFIRVKLDEKCKQQQVGEGWFGSVGEVPKEAVTISPHEIMSCRTLICGVPHAVKAEAVYQTLTSKITNKIPATILKRHENLHLFLDQYSASKVINFQ